MEAWKPIFHTSREAEVKATLEAMKRAAALLDNDPERRRQARYRTGMYTKDDKLKKAFGG